MLFPSQIAMAFVLSVFGLVFLMRDAQTLALRGGVNVAARLAVYGAVQVGGIALMAWFELTIGTSPLRAWTDRLFALACLLVQVAEIGIAWALRKAEGGRMSWVGWMLPSPVLLAGLLGASFALRAVVLWSFRGTVEAVVLLWLSLVYAASFLLSRVGGEGEDIAFTGDFALLTGCAALIFLPSAFF